MDHTPKTGGVRSSQGRARSSWPANLNNVADSE